jgi:hypothetical protein
MLRNQQKQGVGMIPIYDRDVTLVGWLAEGGHLYDVDMQWVAYAIDRNLWSVRTGSWLGPANGSSLLDRAGKVVAWSSAGGIAGSLRPLNPLPPLKPLQPLTPLKPLTPLRPLKPLDPIGGWSAMSWDRWLIQ